jgi:hypothetical protein
MTTIAEQASAGMGYGRRGGMDADGLVIVMYACVWAWVDAARGFAFAAPSPFDFENG